MSPEQIYTVMGIALIGFGLYALIMRHHLVRRLMAVNVMGSGVFVVFVSIAPPAGVDADPIPQAMVLTGIVVAVSATAVGLVLVRRIFDVTGNTSFAGLFDDRRGRH